jgi:hypothetical protein
MYVDEEIVNESAFYSEYAETLGSQMHQRVIDWNQDFKTNSGKNLNVS